MAKAEANWYFQFLHNLANRFACADCGGGCDPQEQCRMEAEIAFEASWPVYQTGGGHAQAAAVEQEPLLRITSRKA